MAVRNDQLDAAQAASGQTAQEVSPERLCLAAAGGHAEHLAAPVGVDRDGDRGGDGDDPAGRPDYSCGSP